MDGATSSSAFGGQSSDVTTPGAYDDDARHFAITASQVPKPTTSMPPPPVSFSGPSLETNVKDAKSLGTRIHEECHDADVPGPRLRSSRLYKGKGKDTLPVEKEKKKPLRLLDLPVDILKDIVKEVTHTNDLTSLALCHSALHRLAVPHIYSRFDIVWPDTTTHAEPRSGVDALTYGLATLVMAEEIFGEAPGQRQDHTNRFNVGGMGTASETTIRRRKGNHYAQFTRKFSLGNGPADWVQEYLITKEGGKMLGTLVALAVARMRALETFIWDMPTGILRDVWLALSSLGDRNDGTPCRLEKLWVRWHDNSSAETTNPIPPPPPPPPLNLSAMPTAPLNLTGASLGLPPSGLRALDRVEHPSFSTLPPLKSLSVLDIDELAYLDEMSVLVGRSIDKLRELRVGIARHAQVRDWVTVWEGDSLEQVDANHPGAGSITIGEKRLGGILGILTGFVCDIKRPKITLPDRTESRSHSSLMKPVTSRSPVGGPLSVQSPGAMQSTVFLSGDAGTEPAMASPHAMTIEVPDGESTPAIQIGDGQPPSIFSSPDVLSQEAILESDPLIATSLHTSPGPATPSHPPQIPSSPTQHALRDEPILDTLELLSAERQPLDYSLRLESLELERVPLSVPVLQRAIDWTTLTSITLLNCQNHEQLWKTLRRAFAPVAKSPTYPHPRRSSSISPRKASKTLSIGSEIEFDYSLRLKKIHTNTVSPSLIAFIKETLAPNSLEVLFLQEARNYQSSVNVDSIFRGPLKRHRSSLKKLLIDSSEKGSDGMPTNSSRWRRWMLNRDILAFVCSGKMPALRELGMAVDYRDWHFFLQRLPSIPHIRSLYLPFLADHVHGTNVDPRELALQIVDIVALRPEVELCYMGIANKCFEILENRRDSDGRPESHLGMAGHSIDDGVPSEAEDEDDDEDEVEDLEDEDEDEVEDEDESDEIDDTETDEDEDDDDTDSEGSELGMNGARLRLREILFYDDKVAIFKARHGRL
ncbi:Hypothetical protein R9X50_00091200 [Acrodontium crateriforme]|uniref:F-box domain-containing protein n=1 Tax=Acrodontium crateriforme TaxID=150365 RepID=A0AAQ3M441_9PEZI|nr:Hypothetical protein R9X50_00091200 [Acrodontium crateriforme]